MKAQTIAVLCAVCAIAGAVGGWMVNGWRLAGELERRAGVIETQQQSLETLKGANERCTAGVADVRKGLAAFYSAQDRRSKAVEEAVAEATRSAARHYQAASEALSRPPAAPGEECDRAAAEAAAYARKRKGAP